MIRQVIWGMVEFISRSSKVPEGLDDDDIDTEEKENEPGKLDETELIIPLSFSSSKNIKKRKRKNVNKNHTHKFDKSNLPILKYDGSLIEHNIYKVYSSEDTSLYPIQVVSNNILKF